MAKATSAAGAATHCHSQLGELFTEVPLVEIFSESIFFASLKMSLSKQTFINEHFSKLVFRCEYTKSSFV